VDDRSLNRRSAPPRWVGPTVVAALALILWLTWVRHGFPGYDMTWSLLWGRELLDGHVPDLDSVSTSPTPHPLAILVAAPLSLLGPSAAGALKIGASLALALLGWTAFRLGAALFSGLVGLVAAAVVVTRPLVVTQSVVVTVDVAFLALVLLAARIEVERPRAGMPVLAALGAAGLLRPEAWVLAAAYVLYVVAGGSEKRRLPFVLAALAAPCAWALLDLVATGDPLYSLHATGDLAVLLDRPRGGDTALSAVPGHLRAILGTHVLVLGVAGALAALVHFRERCVLPLALLGIGLAIFLAIGVLGLPVLRRYLLISAMGISLFCAIALGGWLSLPAAHRARAIWAAAAVLGWLTLAVGGAQDLSVVSDRVTLNRALSEEKASLGAFVRQPAVRRSIERCGRVRVRDFRLRPVVAFYADVDPRKIDDGEGGSAHGLGIAREGTTWTAQPCRPD
jgi:hypothetical protein